MLDSLPRPQFGYYAVLFVFVFKDLLLLGLPFWMIQNSCSSTVLLPDSHSLLILSVDFQALV